jgi:hypothetical protein
LLGHNYLVYPQLLLGTLPKVVLTRIFLLMGRHHGVYFQNKLRKDGNCWSNKASKKFYVIKEAGNY